jgi:cation/acetate symporter
MTIFLGFAAAAFVGYDKIVAADKGGNMACPLLAKVLGGDFFFAFISAVRVCNDLTVVTGLVLSAASAFAHDFYSHSLRRGNATREGAGEGCPLKPRLESRSCRSSLRLPPPS